MKYVLALKQMIFLIRANKLMLLIFHHNFGSDFDLLDTVRSGLDSSNSNIRTFAFMGLVSTVVFDWRKNSCW